jgi:thymidine kinase
MKKNKGSLHVICGPMFSGKSEELIRRLRRATIAKQKVIAFKHSFDVLRAQAKQIVSHNGTIITAISTEDIQDICLNSLEDSVQVVGIDEVQFFHSSIVSTIYELIEGGKTVVVAGLDLDFRGVPFAIMGTLLALADEVIKLKAICTECGYDAHFSQRLVDNMPARYNDPIIKIGAQEAYQARCRQCYFIDQQPQFLL